MTKQEIKNYLETYGTLVNDCDTDVELMMDNHSAICWYGSEYYIPENSFLYTELDSAIYDHLHENYHV